MLRILADENMPALSLFDGLGQVTTTPGRPLDRALLAEADVLLVRSVTQVTRELLAGSPVRFVGSATIGTDHVALDDLDSLGIRFAHAPGCNAMAVAEYVLQAVLGWLARRNAGVAGTTVGIVGLGNVGRRVALLMEALGMRVVACDPLLHSASVPLVSLDEALAADVVTLHVPLVTGGKHPTRHLLNADRLAAMGPGRLLLNTCRGPVVDNTALLALLASGQAPETVLDVWETEPLVPPALLERVASGSPHVAGYSVEGKVRGTWMLYQALCEWLGQSVVQRMPQGAPLRTWPHRVSNVPEALAWLQAAYRLEDDHRRLREAVGLPPVSGSGDVPLSDASGSDAWGSDAWGSEAERAAKFDLLRKTYPVRHEMAGWRMTGDVAPAWQPLLSQLGAVLTP